MIRFIPDIRSLSIFFKDCYRRVNVREYAREMDISPPTASKILSNYHSEGLLAREDERNFIFYSANKESRDFIDLSRIYWKRMLDGVVRDIEEKAVNPTIVLFGSLSKAEVKKDSDIDLAVFASKRDLNLDRFEKRLRRSIDVHFFSSYREIQNKDLASNILNGVVLAGRLST